MTDTKELGIIVTGDIDDVMGNLNSLADTLENLPDTIVNVTANIDTESLTNLEQELTNIPDQDVKVITDVDTSGIQEIATDSQYAVGEMAQIGTTAENVSSSIEGSMEVAGSSISNIGGDAVEASSQIEGIGSKGRDAGEGVADGMDTALIAITAVATASELLAEDINDNLVSVGQLAVYSGQGYGETSDMVQEISNASFPQSEAENYLMTLTQLGVPNEYLKDNAIAMNEVQIATGSASGEGAKFATAIKVLGGNVNALREYYDLAGYAQANVVGGLSAFDRVATILGPKLLGMGYNADQSAIIIAKLSQKFGGNMRAMRKAISDADGDQGKLNKTLGITDNELKDASTTIDGYNGKVQEAVKIEHEHKTGLEKTRAVLDDVLLKYGDLITVLLGFVGLLGVIFGLFPGLLRIVDTIWKPNVSLADRYVKWWGRRGSQVKDLLKTIGLTWRDEGTKSSEGLGKALDSGLTKNEGFISRLKGYGNRILDTIRGWKVPWESASKDINMVKNAEGTWVADSEGLISRLFKFGERVPTGLSEGISKGIGKLGTPVAVAIQTLDALFNADKYYKEGTGTVLVESLGLDLWKGIPVIGGAVDAVEFMLNTLIGTPKEIATKLLGSGVAETLGDYYTKISGFMHSAFENPNEFIASVTKPFKDFYVYLTTTNWLGAITRIPASIGAGLTSLPLILDTYLNGALFNLGSFLRYLYDFPGRAYNALIGLPGTISAIFGSVGIYLSGLPGQISASMTSYWQGLMEANMRSRENVKNSVKWVIDGIWEALVSIWNLPGQMIGNWNSTWQGLMEANMRSRENVRNSILNIVDTIKSALQWIWDLPGNMYLWGKNIIESFVRGIGDTIDGAKGYLESKLAELMRGFKGESPPKEGPLTNIDIWGANIAKAFVEAITRGLTGSLGMVNLGLDELANMLQISNLRLPSTAVNAINNQNTNQSAETNYHITIDLTGLPSNITEEQAKTIGNNIGEGIKESTLPEQATTKGYSTYNRRR